MPTVEWTSWPPGFSQSGGNLLEAAPLTSTYFSILVKNAADCADRDTLLVRVRRDVPVYVPTAFSPDGDGLNDRLEIFAGPGVARVVRFEIFDRWGELVFEAADFEARPNGSAPDGSWDGQLRGRLAPPAVYVWWAEIELADGRREVLKGDVGLVR